MSQDLAIREENRATGTLVVRTMDDLARLGKMLAASGYFQDAKDAAQAGVKVLAGLEMGIGAFAAMAGIHVIKGKPTVGAHLIAAAIKRHPRYNYRVLRHDNEGCEIQFYEDGQEAGISSFTIDDAKAAGLMGNDPWKRSPRNMVFARAISNGMRWYAPDVFDAPTYTPEELGANADAEGNIIDAEVRAAPAPEKPKAAPAIEAEAPAPAAEPEAEETPPAAPEAAAEAEAIPPFEPTKPAKDPKALAMNGEQWKQIVPKLVKLGVDPEDQAATLSAVSAAIGRDVTSLKDVTRFEGARVVALDVDVWAEKLDAHRTAAEAGPSLFDETEA